MLFIVIGELCYGALFSIQSEKNKSDIQYITQHYSILNVDENTTLFYGTVKTALRKKGKPIPENDIWIAAIALQYNLVVVTRDKHFNEIDGLKIKKW